MSPLDAIQTATVGLIVLLWTGFALGVGLALGVATVARLLGRAAWGPASHTTVVRVENPAAPADS